MYFQSFFVFLPDFKQCCISSNWKLFLYHLKPFFPSNFNIEPYFWLSLALTDSQCSFLTYHGPFWLTMVLSDLPWSFLTYHGPFWLTMVLPDSPWSFSLTMVLPDLPWSFLTYPCPSWLKTQTFSRWLCPSWPNTDPSDLIN